MIRRGGATVVEILRLGEADAFPGGDAWILIEKREALYFVRGQAKGMMVEASLAATGMDSAEVAIRGALAWADLLSAPVIYVRDAPSEVAATAESVQSEPR
jgi:hypothetical protein